MHKNLFHNNFDLLHSNTTRHNPPDAKSTIPSVPSSPLSTCAPDGHLQDKRVLTTVKLHFL